MAKALARLFKERDVIVKKINQSKDASSKFGWVLKPDFNDIASMIEITLQKFNLVF